MNSNIWVCIASGPSLTDEDIDYCRLQGWNLATCNLSFRRVPDAKVFYASDTRWWDRYEREALETLRKDCKLFTNCRKSAKHIDRLIKPECARQGAWPTRKGEVTPSGMSGHLLIQAVSWEDPTIIALLGYDHQHTDGLAHSHEDYPKEWPNAAGLDQDKTKMYFENTAKEATVPIINATRETALTCFERVKLEEINEYIANGGLAPEAGTKECSS